MQTRHKLPRLIISIVSLFIVVSLLPTDSAAQPSLHIALVGSESLNKLQRNQPAIMAALIEELKEDANFTLVEATPPDTLAALTQKSGNDDLLAYARWGHSAGADAVLIIGDSEQNNSRIFPFALVGTNPAILLWRSSFGVTWQQSSEIPDILRQGLSFYAPTLRNNATKLEAITVNQINTPRGLRDLEIPLTVYGASILAQHSNLLVTAKHDLRRLFDMQPLTDNVLIDAASTDFSVTISPAETPENYFSLRANSHEALLALVKDAAMAMEADLENNDPSLRTADSLRHYLVNQADLAYVICEDTAFLGAAQSAWDLGERSPRLAELITIYMTERILGWIKQEPIRMAHYYDRNGLDFFFKDWLQISSSFTRQKRYYRGMQDFLFPEDLYRVDWMLEAYRIFLEAARDNPELRKLNNEGHLAPRVLLAATYPQILIYREPHAERYTLQLATQAEELRSLLKELKTFDLPTEQQREILAVEAFALPFWSRSDWLTNPNTLKDFLEPLRGPNNFTERSYAQNGLISAYYVSRWYPLVPEQAAPFCDIQGELQASPDASDRVLGDLVGYFEYPFRIPFEKQREPREAMIYKLFDDFDHLPDQAEQDPVALGIPVNFMSLFFDCEGWTNRNFKTARPVYLNSSAKPSLEPLTAHLLRNSARRFYIYCIQHWPENESLKLQNTFSYWSNGPTVRNNQDALTDEVVEYYLPLITEYYKEALKPEPNRSKVLTLRRYEQEVLNNWPEIIVEAREKAGIPNSNPNQPLPQLSPRLKQQINSAQPQPSQN